MQVCLQARSSLQFSSGAQPLLQSRVGRGEACALRFSIRQLRQSRCSCSCHASSCSCSCAALVSGCARLPPPGLLSNAGEHVLVLGRQDYVVRSVRIDSKAETWNATFSRLYMMGRDSANLRDFFTHGAAPKLEPGRPHAGAAAHCYALYCMCCVCSIGSAVQWRGQCCWAVLRIAVLRPDDACTVHREVS